MKRLFSVLVILVMLLVPVLSVAEATASYTHTNGQFTFQYPAGWTLLNKETISTLMDMVEDYGDEQLNALMNTYGPAIRQADMVMLINETGMANITIAAQEVGVRLDADTLEAMAPLLVNQMSATMDGLRFQNEGTVVTVKGNSCLLLEYGYELAGQMLYGAQLYVPGATSLYCLGYTCSDLNEYNATSDEFYNLVSTLEVK